MKAEQLYTMRDEHTVARHKAGKEICKVIDEFTENVFYQCELRGYLLSDEEVIDITVAAMYDLLRNTKDYDGQ
jgi:IS30 family transposase